MSLRTLPASALILSPLKAAGFLLGGIALAIIITGCSPAESEKSEREKQASSSAVASSESQKAAVSSTKPAPKPAETIQAPTTAMSPKETYIQMMTEYSNIKTYDDIEAVASKYGSKAVIANTESKEESQARKNFMSMSEAEKDQLITQIKRQLSSIEINTIQESVNGSTATVSVRSTSGWKSTVILVLENNQWKVDSGT